MFRIIRLTAVLLLYFSLSARAQSQEGVDWPALKILVTRYYQFYFSLVDSLPPDRVGFLDLFVPGQVALMNDYCKGTVRFPTPEEYYNDITGFLNNNSSLITALSIYLSPLDKVIYARDKEDRYFIWLFKEFDYTRGRVSQQFWRRERLTVQYMGRELGYRIAAIEEVFSIPPDLDGDQVADSWDQCPGTARGTRVCLNGCPVHFFKRLFQQRPAAEDPALSAGPGAGRTDPPAQAPAKRKWHWKNTNDGWIRVQE